MEFREVLVRNMKAARERLGYSQAKLAELAGTSVAFIGEIESFRKSPSLENIGKIAEALGLEVYELFLDEEVKGTFDRQKLLTEVKKELEGKISKDIDATIRKYLKG